MGTPRQRLEVPDAMKQKIATLEQQLKQTKEFDWKDQMESSENRLKVQKLEKSAPTKEVAKDLKTVAADKLGVESRYQTDVNQLETNPGLIGR